MTLQLILVRHAKSDWDDPEMADRDRPLNARGQRSASAIGGWLAENGFHPQQVLSSPARRTLETWDLIAGAAGFDLPAFAVEDLYLASAQKMLDILRKEGKSSPLLLLGHNPGIGTLAAMLPGRPPSEPGFRQYPTGFTSVFGFEVGDWALADWGSARLLACIGPRQLLTD